MVRFRHLLLKYIRFVKVVSINIELLRKMIFFYNFHGQIGTMS